MPYGRYFEEFKVGEVIRHWPSCTITEADDTWFSLLTMNQHPLHIDAHYTEKYTQHGQRLVNGTLVFAIGVGMTVADISGRASGWQTSRAAPSPTWTTRRSPTTPRRSTATRSTPRPACWRRRSPRRGTAASCTWRPASPTSAARRS